MGQQPARRRSAAALRRTAIHEAGHAIAAEAFGIGCSEVSIVPDYEEGTAGHCISPVDPYEIMAVWEERRIYRAEGWRSAARAGAMQLMSGAIAERLILGRAGPGAGDDRRRAAWLVNDLTDAAGSVAATCHRLERAAAGVLRSRLAQVQALADRLLVRGVVTGAEIAELSRVPDASA